MYKTFDSVWAAWLQVLNGSVGLGTCAREAGYYLQPLRWLSPTANDLFTPTGKILHFVQNDSMLVILSFFCEGSCKLKY